jgi:hypothetical protein
MSEVGQSARVTIIAADYVAVAESHKFTIVGSGITLVGLDPQTGHTAPISVVAIATFDPKFLGESPLVEFSFETDDGELVELPAPPDQIEVHPQPLRITTGPNPLLPTVVKGVDVPADAVRPKVQMMMQFQSGLPLVADRRYLWRMTIDGETRDEWTESLYVMDLSKMQAT